MVRSVGLASKEQQLAELERLLHKVRHTRLRSLGENGEGGGTREDLGGEANGAELLVSDALEERYRSEPREKMLLRFLQCCEHDPKFAAETIVKDLVWRSRNKVEALVLEHPRQILGCDPREVLSKFLCRVQGKDRNGRPVVYFQAKSLDARGILSITSIERYIRYQARWREIMIRSVIRANPEAEAPYLTMVMDLSGVRLGQANRQFYSITKRMADLDQWHFPGVTGAMIIINSKFFFEMVWKAVRKFLSPQVENKISIVGSGEGEIHAALRKLIDDTNIPKDFGGFGPELDWRELDPVYTKPYIATPQKPEIRRDSDKSNGSDAVAIASAAAAANIAQFGNQRKTAGSAPSDEPHDVTTHDDDATLVPAQIALGAAAAVTCSSNLSQKDLVDNHQAEIQAQMLAIEKQRAARDAASREEATDLGSFFLPSHIANLVNDRSDPPRVGLRSEILAAVESIHSERDTFEHHALQERALLRQKLRELHKSQLVAGVLATGAGKTAHAKDAQQEPAKSTRHLLLDSPANLAVIKNGLLARANALEEQLKLAQEECRSHSRAVKFARNYIEQEALKREEDRTKLQHALSEAQEENRLLEAAVRSSLGEAEVERVLRIAAGRPQSKA